MSNLFGQVQRRAINAPMRNSEFIQVEEMKKGKGRLKIKLVEVIKNDMLIKKVLKTTTLDRIEQQKRIDVADFD